VLFFLLIYHAKKHWTYLTFIFETVMYYDFSLKLKGMVMYKFCDRDITSTVQHSTSTSTMQVST